MATFASKYVAFTGSDLGKPSEKQIMEKINRYFLLPGLQLSFKIPKRKTDIRREKGPGPMALTRKTLEARGATYI